MRKQPPTCRVHARTPSTRARAAGPVPDAGRTTQRAWLTPRLLTAFVVQCMIGALASGCLGPTERRSARELCLDARFFPPDSACGSPADALRVARSQFLCAEGESSCRMEGFGGPLQRTSDGGGALCCYTYTLVTVDDSDVN